MNVLGFEKILFNYDKIDKVKNNKHQFPIHATVSLGNYCNHKCLWCTAYNSQLEKSKLMDIDLLLSFLQKARSRGLKAVTYVGNGEPTVHPGFKDLVSAAGELGLEQGMFTNGYQLDTFEKEILKYFTWVRVSLDAGCSKTHQRLHGVENHFNKIIENLKGLASGREKRLPTIGVQYAVHHENIDELYACAELISGLGADYFSIKPVFTRGSVGKKIEANKLTVDDLSPVVNKVQRDFETSGFSVFYREHQVLSHQKGKSIYTYERCIAGFYNINIYEDQKVIFCGPRKIGVGDITDTLDEIENNILTCSSELDLSKCPAGCRYHGLNHLVSSVINQKNIREKHVNFI